MVHLPANQPSDANERDLDGQHAADAFESIMCQFGDKFGQHGFDFDRILHQTHRHRNERRKSRQYGAGQRHNEALHRLEIVL